MNLSLTSLALGIVLPLALCATPGQAAADSVATYGCLITYQEAPGAPRTTQTLPNVTLSERPKCSGTPSQDPACHYRGSLLLKDGHTRIQLRFYPAGTGAVALDALVGIEGGGSFAHRVAVTTIFADPLPGFVGFGTASALANYTFTCEAVK